MAKKNPEIPVLKILMNATHAHTGPSHYNDSKEPPHEGVEIASSQEYRAFLADKASDAACQIEHIVDANAIRRFVIFSEAIVHRDDAKNLRTYLSEAISFLESPETASLAVLTEFDVGKVVAIQRFGRNIGQADLSMLSLGDTVTIDGFSLDKTSIRLNREGAILEIPIHVAENIWVAPVADVNKA